MGCGSRGWMTFEGCLLIRGGWGRRRVRGRAGGGGRGRSERVPSSSRPFQPYLLSLRTLLIKALPHAALKGLHLTRHLPYSGLLGLYMLQGPLVGKLQLHKPLLRQLRIAKILVGMY